MADVKICGISSRPALDAAVCGGARYVGFVHFPPSPRNLSVADAEALGRALPSQVRAVAVMVEPDVALIAATVSTGARAVQVHKCSPERLGTIRALLPADVELWAAVPVRTSGDLRLATAVAPVVDRILYDAKPPEGAPLPGGMGLRFDWSLLDGFAHPRPWLLSGGLDPDNVREAIARARAPAVDVSSGVESAPGVKDVDRIASFLHAARA